MKKSKFTGEQIAFALRQAEVGTPVAEVCRKMGVSEATFYRWKQTVRRPGTIEVVQGAPARGGEREAQEALSLDKVMLQEVFGKKVSARPASGDRTLGAGPLWRERAPRPCRLAA